MSDNLIYKSIQRSNLNRIMLSLIVLAIAIGVGYVVLPYFVARVGSPTKLDEKALAGITAGSAPIYFQQIDGDMVFDTGYEEYTEYDSGARHTDAYFAMVSVGNHIVMVRVRNSVNESQTTYVGALVQPNNIQSELFADFRQQVPQAADDLVPLLLDTIDNSINWYAGAAVMLALLIGGLWGVATFFQRNSDPRNHPTLKKLARFGDVDKIVDSIDKELGSLPDEVGRVKLTRNWLVYARGGTFRATRLSDLVWLYKHIHTTKAYGVITTSRVFSAYFRDKHGETIIVQGKEAEVNAMLQVVVERAPWVFAGYSNEMKRAWDKDRFQLVAAVEQRKAQYDAQNSAM